MNMAFCSSFINGLFTIPFHFGFHFAGNVTETESRFHWPRKVEETKFPLFGDPQAFLYVDENQKPEEAQVRSVCGKSQSCRRDYYATNDVSVARASKKTDTSFAALQSSQEIGKYGIFVLGKLLLFDRRLIFVLFCFVLLFCFVIAFLACVSRLLLLLTDVY